MAIISKAKTALPSLSGGKYKYTPPPSGPKTPTAIGKPSIGSKSVGKPSYSAPSSSKTYKVPSSSSTKSYKAPPPPAPKVKAFDPGGKDAYAKPAYTGAGSSGTYNPGSYGGAKVGTGPSLGTSYGGSASKGGDYGSSALAGPVGGAFGSTSSAPVTVKSATPSSVAQLALSSLAGRGNAQAVTRRRNRAGAGYNTSLSPEQLRNIAARRVGG